MSVFVSFEVLQLKLFEPLHDKTNKMPRLISLCWAHRSFCWFCHAVAHFEHGSPHGYVGKSPEINHQFSHWSLSNVTCESKVLLTDVWVVLTSDSSNVHKLAYFMNVHKNHKPIFEPLHEKTCFNHMWTTKVQISLCIRAVWSALLLFVA